MMKSMLFFTCCMLFSVLSTTAAEPKYIIAPLKKVTVYSTGAFMTHTASLSLPKGSSDWVIEGLCNTVDINSIQIKAPNTVTLLSQEFSNNFLITNEKKMRIQILEDSLANLERLIEKTDVELKNNQELLDVLKSNKEIRGTESGISIEQLSKLMDYYESKQSVLHSRIYTLTDERKDLALHAERLKLQLKEEQSKNTNKSGRLSLQLLAAIAGKVDITITYIASQASWKPFYDVRVDKINNPVVLVYKAKIVQSTGIDWTQVDLSLSTSLPSRFGTAPVLENWFVGFLNPYHHSLRIRGVNSLTNLEGKVPGVDIGSAPLQEVVVVGYQNKAGDLDKPEGRAPVFIVDGNMMSEADFKNIHPNAIKNMEVLKSTEAERLFGQAAAGGATVVTLKNGLQDYTSISAKSLHIQFDIETPYDVPSNGKDQIAVLHTINMQADYQHTAIPKITNDVYLVATVNDWEKYNLLSGEAAIILEGTHVGKTFLNPAITTDSLPITLGQDNRVQIFRKKLEDFSSVKFLGSNKVQKFVFDIIIKNTKSEQIKINVVDQIPLSTNSDISVELMDQGGGDFDKTTGGLSWHVTLAPGASHKISFSYSVRYPKDKNINLE